MDLANGVLNFEHAHRVIEALSAGLDGWLIACSRKDLANLDDSADEDE